MTVIGIKQLITRYVLMRLEKVFDHAENGYKVTRDQIAPAKKCVIPLINEVTLYFFQ